jgi:hypothetical protein
MTAAAGEGRDRCLPSRPVGHGGADADDGHLLQDITDPATGLSRLLSERCSTCILRPGARCTSARYAPLH